MYFLRSFDYLMCGYLIATSAVVEDQLINNQLEFVAATSQLSPVSKGARCKLRERESATENQPTISPKRN